MDPNQQPAPIPAATNPSPITPDFVTPATTGPGVAAPASPPVEASAPAGPPVDPAAAIRGMAGKTGNFFVIHKVLVAIIAAVVVILIIAALLIFKPGSQSQTSSGSSSIAPQGLDPSAFRSLLASNDLTGSKEDLVIASSVLFKNKLTLQGDTNSAGTLTSEGPFNALKGVNVSGASTLDTLGTRSNLTIGGSSVFQGPIEAHQQVSALGGLNVTGTSTFTGITVNGNASVSGTLSANTLSVNSISFGHIITNGSTPGISPGVAAGSGSVQITGNDTSGVATINVPSSTSAGELAIISFTKAYAIPPHVVISPISLDGAQLQYYVVPGTNSFSIRTASGLAGNHVYSFDYAVMQ